MKIKQLSIGNIGPFIEAEMCFLNDSDKKQPPAVLITGENGTGKSIILDAIRGMFGPQYCKLERDIRRRKREQEPYIKMILESDGKEISLNSYEIRRNDILPGPGDHHMLMNLPENVQKGADCPNWIADFWPSASGMGSYRIETLESPDHRSFLSGTLQGIRKNADITRIICHSDYVRDSRDPAERDLGEHLYQILEKIIEKSLLDGGRLSHVARSAYEPVIIQNGQPVSLENLSSGNLYLIQNMAGLLSKMYSVHVLRQKRLSDLCLTPGLLLIDEAENQLHPKWQKRFIRSVLDIFPNLQIIATTHSPFIISSVADARLFVCNARTDHCIVTDATAEYSNKPVDEILMSALFEETLPFNEEISSLIERRENAVRNRNQEEQEQIEARLRSVNPQYFSYLDLDKLLGEMNRGDIA